MQKISFSSGKMDLSLSFSLGKTDVGRKRKSRILLPEIRSCFLPNENTADYELFFEHKKFSLLHKTICRKKKNFSLLHILLLKKAAEKGV